MTTSEIWNKAREWNNTDRYNISHLRTVGDRVEWVYDITPTKMFTKYKETPDKIILKANSDDNEALNMYMTLYEEHDYYTIIKNSKPNLTINFKGGKENVKFYWDKNFKFHFKHSISDSSSDDVDVDFLAFQVATIILDAMEFIGQDLNINLGWGINTTKGGKI